MQLLRSSLDNVIHADVLEALRTYRATGVLDWTPPPGTPEAEASPACAVCNDVGELAVRVPGSVIPRYVDCDQCGIKAARRRERMLTGIDGMFRNASFGGYQTAARTDEARSIGRLVEKAAMERRGSVLLWGPAGSLKTTLLTAAYLELVETGQVETAVWTTAAGLLDAIRKGYDRDSHVVEAPILERASTCDLLMLDGLGEQNITERNAPWIQEQIYLLIDHRLNGGRQTFITTNLDPSDERDGLVKQLGSAIVSRLFGLCLPMILRLDQGVDFRTVRP